MKKYFSLNFGIMVKNKGCPDMATFMKIKKCIQDFRNDIPRILQNRYF